MESKDNKEEDNLNKIKENFIENNIETTKNNSFNSNQGFSRDKALNYIKYGTKALNDNFKPQSIIEEEDEENETKKNSEQNNKEGENENREFQLNRKSRIFLKNSKSYVALRDSYNIIQNQVMELTKKDQDNMQTENAKENTEKDIEYSNKKATEQSNGSIDNLEEEKKNIIQQFEDEDKSNNSLLPLTGNFTFKEYRKCHESISTPLDIINESNEKYHQLENSVNQAKEKLDKLMTEEENKMKKESISVINNINAEDSKNNTGGDSIRKTSFSSKHNSNRVLNSSRTTISSISQKEKISDSKSTISTGNRTHNRKKSGNNKQNKRSSSSSGKKKKRSGSSRGKRASSSKSRSRSPIKSKMKRQSRSRSISRSHSRGLSHLTNSFDSDSLLNNCNNSSSTIESAIEHEFSDLKEQILNGIGEFEEALNEFIEWKNSIIENNIPSNMKLEVTLLFSRLFRSKNIMLTPLFETLRKIDIYSKRWICQLKSKRSIENWTNLIEKFCKRNKLLMYKNCQYDANDFINSDGNGQTSKNINSNDRDYYEKKINYLKNKLHKYKEKFNVNESGSDSDGEKITKKKNKNKIKSISDQKNIPEDLFIRILNNEKRKLKSNNELFNRTLKKRRPRLRWDIKRRIAINNVRYKYLIQKSFRALPYLIQNLKDYITKGFWNGPHLFRNHYISEYNGELYTRTYYKKYTSPDIIPNHNSCTDLKALLKLSTKKVNPSLVRSNSFACGKEFPWINSRSLNETSFKETNKKVRDKMEKDLLGDDNQNIQLDDPVKNIDDYINNALNKDRKINSKNDLADLTKDQICDIITILYPDTESIVKIYNEDQPKFYVGSDDEYDQIEAMDNKAIKDEIKKTTNSTKLLNAVEDSEEEKEIDELDDIDWSNEILQEDIVYDRIKNNIDYSEDYIPWRSETEELYFNPYDTEQMSYSNDLKSKVREYLSNYNSNTVNGLSYKNRFDVKANISHKIKGEEGDIDEGIIGGGLGFDFEGKKGELTEYFDPEKTWFSLQDVMELTLLHAQQLETMNEEYNKKMDELNQKLKESENQILSFQIKNNDKNLIKEYLKKIEELQDTLEKRNKEVKMLQEENDYYRECAKEESYNTKIFNTIPQSHPIEGKPNIPEKIKIPNRIKKYSFFNRLEAFNTEKIKHHDRLLQEQMEKYLHDFEYRLSHEYRLNKPNPEYEKMLNKWRKTSQKLKAEFMPLQPGLQRPQFYKELKLHGIESPWGGKFHIPKEKQKEGNTVNYLNLFEIAKQTEAKNNFIQKNNS
ncbi:hypothetical protein BCR36DRAFT_370922 [Piromyces finnis]|uniref:Uncharacterized protein n=1 Tax=Piromyces finnis TaxID=1754191 RepID=A0A1Y1V7T9_9FUNG|nr:hypothetical protein BCR36DRAFT_370922 [Piromyces finnis]|eukprot:ORX49355.1 hypothetical protein BCR36DRAFT_370922 [Piromyces finnis]